MDATCSCEGRAWSRKDAMTVEIPSVALSVRQPWAWAIIHAGKNIENRSWQAVARGAFQPRRVAIHAARGMTQAEYVSAARFMLEMDVVCPPPADLDRGGVIGAVTVVDIVRSSSSPWFMGPRGLVLANPVACAFTPAVGALGFFRWLPDVAQQQIEVPLWMQRFGQTHDKATLSVDADLFE